VIHGLSVPTFSEDNPEPVYTYRNRWPESYLCSFLLSLTRLHWLEAALVFSENVTAFVIYGMYSNQVSSSSSSKKARRTPIV
jgi:hypothetical protein